MNYEEIAVKLAEYGKEIGSLKHRVCELEQENDTIQELVISVKELALNMQSMIKEQEKASKSQIRAFERIEALEKQPVKRYETMVTALLTAIASAVVTFLATTIF